MKIVVCVKQVPGTQNVSIDPETKQLIREGIELVMNPFDTYALEQGILVKEALGGEVIALSMGPKKAESTLREAIACGADSGILINDRPFAGSDTWATSYILAKAIEKIGDVGLVICGKQAVDGDTAQVGPGIAQHLGWPQAAFVSAMPEMSDASVVVRRMFEFGYDECRVKLPAVLTVVKDINSPRIPSLRSRMASKKAEFPIWTNADLGLSEEVIGLNGSPTRVVQTSKPPGRDAATLLLDGSAEENAKRLVAELRRKSLV
jgi:electron transfer flavoprotein beta subunit